jgi:hypothetical protein
LEHPGHGSQRTDNTEQKGNNGELTFARHYQSTDAKPDLHFRRNGTIHTPGEVDVRQVGKLTAAATKSKKNVRRRDRRMRDRCNVPATAANPHLFVKRETTAILHALVATNQRMQKETYISAGMLPSILPSR